MEEHFEGIACPDCGESVQDERGICLVCGWDVCSPLVEPEPEEFEQEDPCHEWENVSKDEHIIIQVCLICNSERVLKIVSPEGDVRVISENIRTAE